MLIPSPGGVGSVEAGGTAALTFFGVDQSTALAFMLVYHFTQLLPAVAMGAAILVGEPRLRRQSLRGRAQARRRSGRDGRRLGSVRRVPLAISARFLVISPAGSPMRLRFAVCLVPFLAILAFASCSNETEGQPCDMRAGNSGDDDCASGLVCTSVGAQSDLCCPSDRTTAKTPACALSSTQQRRGQPCPSGRRLHRGVDFRRAGGDGERGSPGTAATRSDGASGGRVGRIDDGVSRRAAVDAGPRRAAGALPRPGGVAAGARASRRSSGCSSAAFQAASQIQDPTLAHLPRLARRHRRGGAARAVDGARGRGVRAADVLASLGRVVPGPRRGDGPPCLTASRCVW